MAIEITVAVVPPKVLYASTRRYTAVWTDVETVADVEVEVSAGVRVVSVKQVEPAMKGYTGFSSVGVPSRLLRPELTVFLTEMLVEIDRLEAARNTVEGGRTENVVDGATITLEADPRD